MVGDLERLREIEYQMENIEKAYGKEIATMYKKPGFDMYAPKWDKKIRACAAKYAEILAPLKIEHEEIRLRLNEEDEIKRKQKYKEI